MGKKVALFCFGFSKQYWNQNEYFILISIELRVCVSPPVSPSSERLSGDFDLEVRFFFGSRSFLLLARENLCRRARE